MMKKTEQTEITQRNLQDSFWIVYTKQTFDKISVKDICNLAGYSSTFYQYYMDVYDVLHRFENFDKELRQ